MWNNWPRCVYHFEYIFKIKHYWVYFAAKKHAGADADKSK